MRLIFFIVLLVHFQNCIFWFLARRYMIWIPNEDFIYGGTEIFEKNTSYQYWVVMYYSAMLFSISDMVASTTAELAYTAFFMVIYLIVIANVFGIIQTLIAASNEKQ